MLRLGNMTRDVYCGSRTRIFAIPDPGVNKALDPDPQHCIKHCRLPTQKIQWTKVKEKEITFVKRKLKIFLF
jgi:hypothetical protein